MIKLKQIFFNYKLFEMDLFKKEFNAKEAISNMDCFNEKPCSSMKTLEQELVKEIPGILDEFKKIESLKNQKTLSKKSYNKERLKRLEEICVEGALPIIKIPKKILQRLDY